MLTKVNFAQSEHCELLYNFVVIETSKVVQASEKGQMLSSTTAINAITDTFSFSLNSLRYSRLGWLLVKRILGARFYGPDTHPVPQQTSTERNLRLLMPARKDHSVGYAFRSVLSDRTLHPLH